MCGLAGWFGAMGQPDTDQETITGMMDRIAHRGPDGRGHAMLPTGAGSFGHVRLAIIDPGQGQQPLWSVDGHSVIVFNGEIYNFRELRAELTSQGARLRTQTDTEVVLELLRRQGITALGRLRGMFALAFWDNERRTGLLARDALGIKPLFLRRGGGRLWFASEAKAFFGCPDWKPELDRQRLHLLLNFRYPAGGHGLMKDVSQLAPGFCLEWTPEGERTTRFESARAGTHSSDDLHDAIVDSVRAHLVADVPVSCYLSGGLDSGIIAFVAAGLTREKISSYTIDAGDDPSELRNAQATAHWLGMENKAGALVPATAQTLDWLLWHLEVPKINALQSAAVAQLAAQQTKVCLSGLGGDELFLGYRAHAHMSHWGLSTKILGPLAAPLGRLLSSALAGAGEGFSEQSRIGQMLVQSGHPARAYGLLRNIWDGMLPRERIYGPRMLDQPLPQALDWLDGQWNNNLSPVDAMADFEWHNKMVDDLLWQEDRVSMAFGLEVRVPFVDTWLAGSLDLLPRNLGRPGRKDRLRDAFASDMPTKMLRRPKSGFQIDIADRLDALFGTVLSQWLAPERVRHHGLFAPAFVARLLALPRKRTHRWHFFMLLLMALSHRWIELFEQGAPLPTTQPQISRTLP